MRPCKENLYKNWMLNKEIIFIKFVILSAVQAHIFVGCLLYHYRTKQHNVILYSIIGIDYQFSLRRKTYCVIAHTLKYGMSKKV